MPHQHTHTPGQTHHTMEVWDENNWNYLRRDPFPDVPFADDNEFMSMISDWDKARWTYAAIIIAIIILIAVAVYAKP
jgi:hypothetical protein